MPTVPDDIKSRREFFRSAARFALLGVLAVGGLVAGRNAKGTRAACVNQGICRGCGQFAGCGLPAALSAKGTRGESAARPVSEWIALRGERASRVRPAAPSSKET